MLYLFQKHYLKCTYPIIKQQKNHFTTKAELKTITTTLSNSINDTTKKKKIIDPVILKNHNNTNTNNNINSFPSKVTTTISNLINNDNNNDNDTIDLLIDNNSNNNRNNNNVESKRTLIFQQCSGIRHKDGKRCSRKVPVQIDYHSYNNEYYCHNHRLQSPFFKRDNENDDNDNEKVNNHSLVEKNHSIQTPLIDDCWSLWIKDRIKSKKAKQQIQKEMMKPLSDQDEGGYIYCYILTDGPRASTDKYCYFKIGRSTNPSRRMIQFMNKCHHTPSLLDVLPWGKFHPKNYHHHGSSSHHQPKRRKNYIAKMNRITYCPYSHRIEKLIHLELSYLYPHPYSFECTGCGQVHREWIRVPRPPLHSSSSSSSSSYKTTTSKKKLNASILHHHEHDGTNLRMSDYQVYLEKIRPIVLHWIQYGVSIDLATRFYFNPSQQKKKSSSIEK